MTNIQKVIELVLLIISGVLVMIDFIILGQIPGTNIFINFYIILGLMVVAGVWFAHRHHIREKLRKQAKISDKAL